MRWLLALLLVISGARVAEAANAVDQNYSDPFEYCAAAGTVDKPGSHYVGPRIPDAILARASHQTDAAKIGWHCNDGNVQVCSLLRDPVANSCVLGWDQVIAPNTPNVRVAAPIPPADNPLGDFDLACNQGQDDVFAELPYDYLDRLSDPETALPIFQRTTEQVQALCEAAAVKQKGIHAARVRTLMIHVNNDCIAALYVPDQNSILYQHNCPVENAKAAAAASQEQLASQAAQSDADKFKALGDPMHMDFEYFHANPFMHQNQTVGLKVYFVQMLSQDEALFADPKTNLTIYLHGVPAAAFTVPHANVAVSLVVEGTKIVEGIGVVPAGRYVGGVACRTDTSPPNCGWF